ncbi:ESPR-type extended signal peptide-containing protein [Haemophilus haemolyticus]|uniref:ESPR-type extended signal peptide-containing protein n=1 Tax=Haemophilus haemolyticus TaxID=726 RepID=UPI000E57174F|nr:ESPR-type extended signal peptide-containing protein [Haemophilus haemolyticus]
MNKIFRIVWNEAAQAWVAVSELTKKHKKRASATVVAVALVAGVLSPFAEASNTESDAGVDSENPAGGYTPPRPTNITGPDGNDLNGLGFGLVVVDKEGHRKEILPGKKIENTTDDDEKISTVITVEPNNDNAPEPPKKETSYLYLVEGDGVKIDQTGRSAKFSVNAGDGLKVNNGEGEDGKLVADTVELTVADGKVTDPDEANKKKLVNAGDLSSALNELGWKVSAGSTTSTVKSGDEVEFKGEGGITVTATTDTNGKHVVTIKTEQPQGGAAAGGSTPVTAGDGISVSADNKVSVNAKTNGGLTVDANGVSVHAKTDGGITVDGSGVSVDTDNTTINVTGGKVSAVTGTITAGNDASVADADKGKLAKAGEVAAAINAAKTSVTNADATTTVTQDGNVYKVAAKVESNKGLETTNGLAVKQGSGITVDGSGVSVKAKEKGGINVDTDGVSVNTDGTTITLDTATGNVKAVTGEFGKNNKTGDTIASNGDENKLATVSSVATAINAAKVKVEAGSGADVSHNKATNTYTVSAKVESDKGLESGAAGLSVKAGDGVTVDNKGVSVKSKTNGGITVGADGVSVQNGNGITVGANGVSVNAKTNGGITVDGSGVSVDTDNTTINVTGGKVSAVTGTITAGNDASVADADKGKLAKAGEVAAAINAAKTSVTNADATTTVTQDGNVYKVAAKVESNKGLETTNGLAVKQGSGITVDGSGVSVKAKEKGGINVDTDGVSVNTDGTTITLDTATGNVKAVTGEFGKNNKTGDTIASNGDENKLATVSSVATAINAAKVKVEAGSGISVEHNPVSNAYTVSAPFEKTENDKGTTVTFKGKTTTEHPNGETKLSGIAAGDISPTSSDAVNGAQIYALNRGAKTEVTNVTIGGNTYENVIVSSDGKNTPLLKTYNTQDRRTVLTNSVYEAIYNMNEHGIKFFHVNDGTVNTKREGHSENDSSASGKYATAIGALSEASGQNAVAMGFGSTVTGDNSIAIGTGNQVNAAKSGAFGDPNIINGKDVNNVAVSGSYAVGNDNIIDSSNTFVLGNDINNKGNSTAVGHTVENSVYLGNKTTARGGDGSQTAALKNIKHDGSEGTTTTAGSIGTVNEAIVNGMSYGGFAGAKGHGVVSVGAADAERRIQNVAAGEISATSTDAINGSQLYSISSRLGNNMNRLNDRINKVGKRADAGTASAIAMANLLQSYRPGLSAATAAVGQYRGQSAIAVGYSRLSDNGKYGVKFSLGANTQGNVGAGAGVAYFW